MNVYIKGCLIVIACSGLFAGFFAFVALILALIIHSYQSTLGSVATVKCLSFMVENVSVASTVASISGIGA